MSARRKRIFIIGVVLLIVFILLIYFRVIKNKDAASDRPQVTQTVQITSVSRSTISKKITFSGDILAIQQANIYSRVSGNIKTIYVDIGDYVPAGKLLARIDDAPLLQTLRQNEGVYNQAKANLENNRISFERNQVLYDKNLISKSELDNSETIMKVSEGQVDAADANVRNAEIQLNYCNIKAPFSGFITKRFLDAGAYISAGGASQSTVILLLSDIKKVKVMVNVLEKDIPSLDSVKEANIRTDAYPDEIFKGKVNKVSQAIDLNTRTMPVQIEIVNDELKLKPGMFADIELVIQMHENTMILPSQSVLNDNRGSYVYVVTADSTIHRLNVQTGITENNNIEIVSGMSGLENIVSSGQEFIREGSKVKYTK